ncbi:glycosyl hydrolase family 28-related protein [Paenibacillus cymbidii]|uniref:glycosyl hydrolase family 28-related protein n=1 Tax=Paenibacillus cymbidii TaxID=1639034 RepID=UPI0014368128|nr:glycosyl hydrolase family 28-related protein [Paenibacillus cymbidii]
MKRIRSRHFWLLTIWAMIVSVLGITPVASADPAHEAIYRGEDKTTNGSWNGVYGSDGYVMPFYTTTSTNGREAGWPTYKPAHAVQLPSYVSAYSMNNNNGYWVRKNPSTDARALVAPSGVTRKLMDAGSVDHTFTVSGEEPFLFTVYSYATITPAINLRLEIYDLSNHLLASRTVVQSNLNAGIYSQFMIQGSFKLKVTANEGAANTQGFFFDPVPASTVSVTSVTYGLPRKAIVTWSNSDTDNKISIARKKHADSEFSEIAVVNGTETSYVDNNLEAGATYDYVLRSVSGRLTSADSATYSVTIPTYQPTTVTLSQYAYTLDGPVESLMIQALLTDDASAPIAGRTVYFELSGEHVGTFIGSSLGSAVSDAYGVAETVYTFPYAGDYTIRAFVLPDDVNGFDSGDETAPLTVQITPWAAPPKIIRLSDAVSPGGAISINGYAIDDDEVEVAIAPADGSSVSPAEATKLDILQTDADGYFVVAKLPDEQAAGVYRVWVKNGYGWSDSLLLNGPRPLFLSEREANAGLSMKLVGRNLDGEEFGAARHTAVRLHSASDTVYTQVVMDVNPFAVDFTVGADVPNGTYTVEISNDNGANWTVLDNGQQLTIVTPGADPLGLGVAWARDFNWSNQLSVLDYGADPGDAADDTAAVQAAVDAAHTAGGGVVYFPSGTYRITRINMPANIVLLGESRRTSVLMYTGNDTSKNFIESTGDGMTVGKQGFAELRVTMDETTGIRPSFFFWIGHDWSKSADRTLRTASEFFMHNVDIDYPIDPAGTTGQGNAVCFIGHERLLMTGNSFRGFAATMNVSYVDSYFTIRDNQFEMAKGTGGAAQGYGIFEHKITIGHPEYDYGLHGPFIGNNAYVYDNVVQNVGSLDNNDGEAFGADGSAFWAYGDVLAGTETTIETAPEAGPLVVGPLRAAPALVLIVGGRGMGQYRNFVHADGNTITVDKPWDIVPDRTSQFSVVNSNANITFYKNAAVNSSGPFQFYAHVADGVMKDNTGVDTQGFQVTAHGAPRTDARFYVRLDGNVLRGGPKPDKRIYSRIHLVTGGDYGTMMYGFDIRNNVLIGNGDNTSPVGILIQVGQVQAAVHPQTTRNVTVEGNTIMDYDAGIGVGKGSDGTLIYRNHTIGVGALTSGTGSVNTVTLEND